MILDLIASIFSPAKGVIEALDLDDAKKNAALVEIKKIEHAAMDQVLKVQQDLVAKQTEVQKLEVVSDDKWVRRARPVSLYLLYVLLTMNYIVHPWLDYIYGIKIPMVDDAAVYVLGGIGGSFSVLRGLEKMKKMEGKK